MNGLFLTPDQIHLAKILESDQSSVIDRLKAFCEGRLYIWSNGQHDADALSYRVFSFPGQWVEVSNASAIFVRDAKYKIAGKPTWRVPTDEDACKRPKCRYRDNEQEEWKEGTLLLVRSKHYMFPFCVCDQSQNVLTKTCCEIMEEATDA